MKTLLLLLLVPPCIVFGRIGYTLEECVKRYGNPVRKVSDTSYVFQKSDVFIRVFLGPKKVGQIEYSKEKSGDYMKESLPYDFILGLLSINSGSTLEEIRGGVGVTKAWGNQEKTMRAALLRTQPEILQVSTMDYVNWEKEQANKKAVAALPGL